MLQQYAYRRNMGCLRVATLLLRGLYLALFLREFPGGRFLRLSCADARFSLDRTIISPLIPAVFRYVLCPVEGVGFILASFSGISILRHRAVILRHTVAIWWHIAAYFKVVVDKERRVCGAEHFFEREFTLVARAKIAALGEMDKRPGDSGDPAAYCGELSSPAYAAAGVRNTWTLCGGGRC